MLDESDSKGVDEIVGPRNSIREIILPVYSVIMTIFLLGAIYYWVIAFGTEDNIVVKLPANILNLIYDIPIISLAMIMGAIGSLLKHQTIRLEGFDIDEDEDAKTSYLTRNDFIFSGAVLGVLSYLFIKSKVIGTLFYETTEPLADKDVSSHGVMLFATAAGYFAYEVLGYAKDKVKQFVKTSR